MAVSHAVTAAIEQFWELALRWFLAASIICTKIPAARRPNQLLTDFAVKFEITLFSSKMSSFKRNKKKKEIMSDYLSWHKAVWRRINNKRIVASCSLFIMRAQILFQLSICLSIDFVCIHKRHCQLKSAERLMYAYANKIVASSLNQIYVQLDCLHRNMCPLKCILLVNVLETFNLFFMTRVRDRILQPFFQTLGSLAQFHVSLSLTSWTKIE